MFSLPESVFSGHSILVILETLFLWFPGFLSVVFSKAKLINLPKISVRIPVHSHQKFKKKTD